MRKIGTRKIGTDTFFASANYRFHDRAHCEKGCLGPYRVCPIFPQPPRRSEQMIQHVWKAFKRYGRSVVLYHHVSTVHSRFQPGRFRIWDNGGVGTKLPEIAVILSVIMLGQRFSGYENRPLGYLLVCIGVIAGIWWIHSTYRLLSQKEGAPKSIGKFRRVLTWVSAAVLVGFVIYPLIVRPQTPTEQIAQSVTKPTPKVETSTTAAAPSPSPPAISASAPPAKQPAVKPPVRPKSASATEADAQPVTTIINATRGIAIAGGTVTNPTVINNGPDRLELSLSQVEDIAHTMAAFAGDKEFSLVIDVRNVTGETHAFALRLQAALLTAGFAKTQVNECMCIHGGCPPLPGVSFQAGVNRRAFTDALTTALRRVGISAIQSPPCGRSGEPDELLVMLLPL